MIRKIHWITLIASAFFIFRRVSSENNCENIGNDLSMSLPTNLALPDSEIAALKSLYDSTQGSQWYWRSNIGIWNFSSTNDACSWQGVRCQLNEALKEVHVVELLLDAFGLKGTLPPELGNLTRLENLDLFDNRIIDTIPPELGYLTLLQDLDLSYNLLSGTLPPELGNLTNIVDFAVYFNKLNGTIPDSFYKLSKLNTLQIDGNLFSGPLPSWPSETNIDLVALSLSNNLFTGTIPSSWANLTHMADFNLGANFLEGTIPDMFQLWGQMEGVEMNDNVGLHGPIPPSLLKLNMQVLVLSSTSLTGTLPAGLGTNTFSSGNYINVLVLHDTYLHGTIPETWASLTALLYLDLSATHASGTLPTFLSTLPFLNYLNVDNCHMWGNLRAMNVSHISSLQTLQLSNNAFSGSLEGLFNASVHIHLTTFMIGHNQMSGSIPAELFRLPIISLVVLQDNCFSGSLPEEALCRAGTLSTLVLDGLSSSSRCRRSLLPKFWDSKHKSYITKNDIAGTIPLCLFHLANLSELSISGNGHSGSLPSNLNMSNSLVSLSLAYNVLTGAIPDSVQTRKWFYLDLSSNRLSGSLVNNFVAERFNFTSFLRHLFYVQHMELKTLQGTNETLYLPVDVNGTRMSPSVHVENNRLSGDIPATARALSDVSVLGTNVFSCKFDRSDLPQHDDGRKHYQCGSNSFNMPYYLWLSLLGTLALTGGFSAYLSQSSISPVTHWHSKQNKYQEWLEDLNNVLPMMPQLALFVSFQSWLAHNARLATLYIVLVLAPVYISLTVFHGRLTHSYAWTVSAAYQSSITSFATMFVFLLVLILLVLRLFSRQHRESDLTKPRSESTTIQSQRWSSKLSPLGVMQALTFWTRFAIYATFTLINLLVVVGVNVLYVYIIIYQSSSLAIFAQIMLSIFKLAWTQICTTSLLRRVIHNFLFKKGNDSSSNEEAVDLLMDSECATLLNVVSVLNNIAVPCWVVVLISPNCLYPVFSTADKVDSAFIVKTCLILSRDMTSCAYYQPVPYTTSFYPPFNYSYQCSSSFVTYYGPTFVTMCLIATFVTPLCQQVATFVYRRSPSQSRISRFLQSTILGGLLLPEEKVKQKGSVFRPNREMSMLITYVGILLTFGAVFPPLALTVCVTLWILVFSLRVKLGRFLSMAREADASHVFSTIETDCRAFASAIITKDILWLLVTICCWFYTLFLFDTLGDAVGFQRAVWVLIVMSLMPVILYLLYQAVQYAYTGTPELPALADPLSEEKAQPSTHAGPAVVEMEMRHLPSLPNSTDNDPHSTKQDNVVHNPLTPSPA